ncbi:MAG: RNA polymerase subunit sigma [Proteobacteria bacterium]|nr:RNA polymerase subunit sigma [Pseudomonadota bacterium]
MQGGIAELIAAANAGDLDSRQRLFARVYEELKQLARRQLAQAGAATLDTTSLVHEAYLKLVGADEVALNNRAHVLAIAGKAMREILIDRARARSAEKRGAGAAMVTLDGAADLAGESMSPEELLRLNDAIEIVANNEPRLLSLIELRVFAGLELAEISALQSVSERTLNRDWQRARARLFALMNTQD